MKITTKTTLRAIVEALREDCYHDALLERAGHGPDAPSAEKALRSAAAEIKAAALAGCLLWTSGRLTTTDRSRIDVRPFENADSDDARDGLATYTRARAEVAS